MTREPRLDRTPAAVLPWEGQAGSAGRADSLRWVLGSLCAGLGALILVAPHRFSAPLFASATGLRDVWGAASLLSGVALLGVAVMHPRRPLALLAHLFAAATLLAVALAFATSGIWVGTTTYVMLAAGAAAGGLAWGDRVAGAPRDLFAAVMGAVAALNGGVLLWLPAASSAPYFGPVRTLLPPLATSMLVGGLVLLVAQLWPGADRRLRVGAHLVAGGAFVAFGLLVSARQGAWTALAVNLVYGCSLMWLPWSGPQMARLRRSPLWARIAFVLATSNSLALILTTALVTRQHEAIVLARLRHASPATLAAMEPALLAELRRGRDLAMLLLLAVAPLAVGGGVLLARRIGRPLAGLADAVGAMATGGAPAPAAAPNEIAEVAALAAAFATLQQRLAERSAESTRLAAELLARAEALEELDRRKDEFLAMLGHELRNPIGAIANSAYVLQQLSPTEPRLRRPTELILRQVDHLIRLLEDLLDVSRVTRGKLTLRPATLDLRQVVRYAVETTRPLFDTKRHELSLELDEAAVELHADGARLEQVVCNLLRNAADYTPAAGRIEVVVRREGDEAVMWVRDNGVGIPRELLARVFEPFLQGQRGPEQGGLGIGLTLVKSLVELHGGSVSAHSAGTGEGAAVEVRLPLAGPPALLTATTLAAPSAS